ESRRTNFLKMEKKLSDTQYAQMQEEEENLPRTISRLQANEKDLDAIKKDMSYLEGKKLEWSMQKSNAIRTRNTMRRMACYLFAGFATLMALLVVVSWYFEMNLQLPITIIAIIAVVMGGYILIRTQNAARDIRQAEVNHNHAISIENHVKIKYVNVKNAVDFTCEKYHVRNAYELQFLYDQYKKEEQEKEKFRRTNDELEHCSRALVDALLKLHMYDARIWVNYAPAIVDSRELVELKHELITRRQKIRARMEYSLKSITDMKNEAKKNMNQLGSSRQQIEQIIHKIELMTDTE
ncbi:MAG: hypothetical protein PUF65_06460, partial [Lachnospiraceae bacterium]|nr:hypothetical protein [Lachnospiraceae bacterium]